MKVEVRLTTLERLDEILGLGVDAVSIGQEGCAAKLPGTDLLRSAAERIRNAGARTGVVLPAAWQRTAAQLMDAAELLAGDGPLTLTVNDLGTLATLAAEPVPGRELAAGLALFPGRPHDAGEEPRGPLESAVYEDAFLQELESLGVRVLEAEAGAVVAVRDGWQVRRLADVTPLAWARSCPTARHHQLAVPDCVTTCDTPTALTANQRWQLGHGHREPVPVADRPSQVPLTVFGNAVYARSTAVLPAGADVVIDARFHTPQALAERVSAVRPQAVAYL
ncbi:hypothetical protein [Streptomyces sp. IB2014 016-6]|uniref:hypothetical protein n=1 Tax=Streptomyces sp. IB2014 016-6 TaxID=2517818 RepID=UPI0011CBAADB|nr:hypothetical protein [Streptomyces sp. IB2014 016-6]TXL83700.1 hypothetical protein EW053_36820 [Streptomyces sp. IB2014 016-6]